MGSKRELDMKMGNQRKLLIFTFCAGMLVAPLSFAGEQKTGMLTNDAILVDLSSQKPVTTDRKRNGKLRTKVV